MSPYAGQRVALGPRTGAIIDVTSTGSVTVHFDSGGVEDVDPNTRHTRMITKNWVMPSSTTPRRKRLWRGTRTYTCAPGPGPKEDRLGRDTLSPSDTGDSGQMHTHNQASHGPLLSIDFIPYEPGIMCSYCGVKPAECTVNGSTLCLEDAENRWGVPVPEVAATPAGPGEALLSRRRALRPCLRRKVRWSARP